MKPRIVDLMCGAGGVTRGYQLAGFHVTGIDIREQPHYCGDEFYRMDVFDIQSGEIRHNFDAAHASPPCPRYIRGGLQDRKRHPDLLPATRELLEATGLPWVIENVPGAPMRPDVVLCGSMFGLPVRRHRWFETNWGEPVLTLACDHSKPIVGVYGHPHGEAGAWPGMLPGTLKTWSEALGIDWMTAVELKDAIPPPYTELIGRQLMAQVLDVLGRTG